jgi:hypothetical protein
VRHQYFVWDEWAYWTERQRILELGSYREFFMRPHVGHWHGIIMAVWRPLDLIFAAKTYLPYVIPTIVAHCIAGFLLFELLCHARIRPAIAAATGVAYLFLAAAAGNVSLGWQICFVAPIALCYLALLAIERLADGGSRWLAALAVAAVFVAIASSNVGLTVLGVTAFVALARRRLALAAAIVAIPGGAYFLWRREYDVRFARVRGSQFDSYFSYARSGLEATIEGIVRVDITAFAWLLFAVAVVGVLIAIFRRDRYWSLFAATLGGAVVFYLSLATQRFRGDPASYAPSSPRYVHVAAALLLPAFAYVVEQVVGNRRRIAFVALLLAFAAVASNLADFVRVNDPYVTAGRRIRSELAATVPLRADLQRVPDDLTPYGPEAYPLGIRRVKLLIDAGKLPCDTDHAEVVRVAAKLGIAAPPRREISCRDGS